MTHTPRIAVISFPGNNCEVESMRSLKDAGMEAVYFRWNDDRAKLEDIDGYFIPGGFSYEDRGRSGMVAGRDPLMDFIGQEAEQGKVVIGNCNGAQILVESGLVPLGDQLDMSLAKNAVAKNGHVVAPGFLSEWVWITPACDRSRCATSNWEGVMHLPIAHGEGRFTTRDSDLLAELEKNDQLVFRYCDEVGKISEEISVTPNGSVLSVAGICNPAGNVIALMPHPERTENGNPYFASMRDWICSPKQKKPSALKPRKQSAQKIDDHQTNLTEIFIGSLITNNEERTVESALHSVAPKAKLRQWKYFAVPEAKVEQALSDLTVFNANKERAYLRKTGEVTKWNALSKREEGFGGELAKEYFGCPLLLRKDDPDTGAGAFGEGSETGVCYGILGLPESKLTRDVTEILSNPHSSTLLRIR